MKHHQTRFLTQKPAKVVLSSMEVVAQSMGFKTHIRNFKVRKQASFLNNNGHLKLNHLGSLVLFSFPQVLCCNIREEFLRLVLFCVCMSQMRVEGLSANKTSHFSVILEASLHLSKVVSICVTLFV